MKFEDIKPTGDLVFIKVVKREKKVGNLYLPSQGEDNVWEFAEVIKVGSGKLLKDGNRAPILVEEGDTIVLEKTRGTELFTYDEEDDTYRFVHSRDILGIIAP